MLKTFLAYKLYKLRKEQKKNFDFREFQLNLTTTLILKLHFAKV